MKYGKFRRGLFRGKMTKSPALWFGYFGWWWWYNVSQLPGPPPKFLTRTLRRCGAPGYDIRWGGRCEIVPRSTAPFSRAECVFMWWWAKRFRPAWGRVAKVFRRGPNGAFCNRSAWTGVDNGLLYGGDGMDMDRLWNEFLRRIEPSEETKMVVEEESQALHFHLFTAGMDTTVN